MKNSIYSFFITSLLAGNMSLGIPPSCDTLAGSHFQSINLYEMGPGPHGPILGKWQVWFDADSVHYAYTDVVVTGHYHCENPEGKITTDIPQGFAGNFLAAKGVLIWDGKWFEKK